MKIIERDISGCLEVSCPRRIADYEKLFARECERESKVQTTGNRRSILTR